MCLYHHISFLTPWRVAKRRSNSAVWYQQYRRYRQTRTLEQWKLGHIDFMLVYFSLQLFELLNLLSTSTLIHIHYPPPVSPQNIAFFLSLQPWSRLPESSITLCLPWTISNAYSKNPQPYCGVISAAETMPSFSLSHSKFHHPFSRHSPSPWHPKE